MLKQVVNKIRKDEANSAVVPEESSLKGLVQEEQEEMSFKDLNHEKNDSILEEKSVELDPKQILQNLQIEPKTNNSDYWKAQDEFDTQSETS